MESVSFSVIISGPTDFFKSRIDVPKIVGRNLFLNYFLEQNRVVLLLQNFVVRISILFVSFFQNAHIKKRNFIIRADFSVCAAASAALKIFGQAVPCSVGFKLSK